MTTKEKIVKKSIKSIVNEIQRLESIIYATPLIDIIKLRKSVKKKMDEVGNNYNNPEFLKFISEAADKEAALFDLAESKKNANKLISRCVTLRMELSDLKTELYFIEREKATF